MPQDRIVTLNYDAANANTPFGPSPRRIAVGPNDSIRFQIGASTRTAHAGCKLRITLHQDAHFSSRVLQHGPSQTGAEPLSVRVRPNLPAGAASVLTGYKCELLAANGQPIDGLSSDGADGGEIVPDTGAGQLLANVATASADGGEIVPDTGAGQ
jgi:hypothetical protein